MNTEDTLKEEQENIEEVEEKAEEKASEEVQENETDQKPDEEEEKNNEPELPEEEKLTQELSEQKDKYLRLYSEFENFRRRSAKERLDLISSASSELMENLLPVLDDMERALKASEKAEDAKSIREGMELIHQKFSKTLKGKGLEEIDVKQGSDFDPEFQEAVTKIPAPDKKLKGKVVDVIEKGYKIGEKILRYTKVVTGE